LERNDQDGWLWRRFFSIPGNSTGVWIIYDTSPAGMHLRGTRKTPGVAQSRYASGTGRSAGKVTDRPDLQSIRGRISSLGWKITVLF
jgi:hypothetical protein